VRVHLGQLEAFEYVFRRWGKQGRGCAYELAVSAEDGDFIAHIGLLDVSKLRRKEQFTTAMTATSCPLEAAS